LALALGTAAGARPHRRLGKIVLATANAGKVAEFRRLLAGCVDVEGCPPGVELPEETGATYVANARLKAAAVAFRAGMPALADDSGLEVAALGGRPGPRSARYGPDPGERIRRLLEELAGERDRRARFVCVLALAHPRLGVRTFRGIVEGRIGHAPRGRRGFGYDPVFLVGMRGQVSFAELSSRRKDESSHRGAAVRTLVRFLRAHPEWVRV
jgi:XTP/dITP diphosphohydrolase